MTSWDEYGLGMRMAARHQPYLWRTQPDAYGGTYLEIQRPGKEKADPSKRRQTIGRFRNAGHNNVPDTWASRPRSPEEKEIFLPPKIDVPRRSHVIDPLPDSVPSGLAWPGLASFNP